MAKFAPYLLRAYMAFRNPKYFLILLVFYISGSVFAHLNLAYDSDWGMTNLILSIEASTASAVLMMVAERTASLQEEMSRVQREQLAAILQHSIEQRQLMQQQLFILTQIRESDQALLNFIKGTRNGSA
jgi:uncharacterized membrane protein